MDLHKGNIIITAEQRYQSFKDGFMFGATGKPLHHAGLAGVPAPASEDDFELGHMEGSDAFRDAMEKAAKRIGIM